MEDALLDDVLALPFLLHHQVMFPNSDDQVLAHTVGGGKNPLWVNESSTAKRLSVLVQQNNLPRPPTRLCLPTPNDPESPGDVLGVRRCVAVLLLLSSSTLTFEVCQSLLLGRSWRWGRRGILHSVSLQFESDFVADVEILAGLVPLLTLTAFRVAVRLLGHRHPAAHHRETTSLHAGCQAIVGTGCPS